MADAQNNEVGASGWTVFKRCVVIGFGEHAAVIKVIFLSNVTWQRNGCVKILVSFQLQDNN